MDHFFGNYDVDDIELTSASILWEKQSLSYVEFLEKEFFDRFIYIPHKEYQLKLLIICFLINSKACGRKIPLPHFYFFSNKPDSGKSTIAKYISNHYRQSNFVYIPEDISGAVLRDMLASVNHNYPVYVLLDNFHPEKTTQRIGAFYGRLLKYTCEESEVSVLMPDRRLKKLNTFGLKVFTSIFSLPESLNELKSRAFFVLCDRSPHSLEPLEIYDWNCVKQEYYRIWGDTATVSAKIKAVFSELLHVNTSILNRRWQLTKYLIAVGVVSGVFQTPSEGIKYFEQYFEWYDSLKFTENKNSLSLLIEEYVRTHTQRAQREREMYGKEAAYDENTIYYSHLFDFLKREITLCKNLSTEKQITEVMNSLGWAMTIVRDSRYRKIDLAFKRHMQS